MAQDNLSHIKRTSQAMDGFSFDEKYLMKAVIPMVENQEGTAIFRMKGEASYDTTSIDATDPANIVISYKLAGEVVATETISSAGSIVNIVKA